MFFYLLVFIYHEGPPLGKTSQEVSSSSNVTYMMYDTQWVDPCASINLGGNLSRRAPGHNRRNLVSAYPTRQNIQSAHKPRFCGQSGSRQNKKKIIGYPPEALL